MLLSKVAVGFWFEWSNHVVGSLCPVSWLSPDELRRGEVVVVVTTGGADPGLALREASRANRWCRSVTELAGEVRRGRGWPVLDDGGGWVPCEAISFGGIVTHVQ